MSTGLENKIKFNFNKPSFQSQFGDGTLSEKRKKEKKGNADNVDDIISASADGLDSVTNFISLFMGKNQNEQPNRTAATAPPPPQKRISPFVWVGGGLAVLLLIALLISSKNGKPS